jgi:hypothetical protein
MKVKAHLHLPKAKRGDSDCISVAPFAFRKGNGTEYYGTVTLTNVKFKVSQPGRKRTLDSGRKNVHAWVVGDMIAATPSQHMPKFKNFRLARYNPRTGPDFVDSVTGEPLYSAAAAYMVGSKVYYLPEDK